jgi:hypothetical protein
METKPALKYLIVYRIDGTTLTPSSINNPASCTTNCIAYGPDPAHPNQFDLFNPLNGSNWPATATATPPYPERSACSTQADRVGITLVANYNFLTGLVGTSVTLTANAAAQLEPTYC